MASVASSAMCERYHHDVTWMVGSGMNARRAWVWIAVVAVQRRERRLNGFDWERQDTALAGCSSGRELLLLSVTRRRGAAENCLGRRARRGRQGSSHSL